MTNIQCCEDGWGHALKIVNSHTQNFVVYATPCCLCVFCLPCGQRLYMGKMGQRALLRVIILLCRPHAAHMVNNRVLRMPALLQQSFLYFQDTTRGSYIHTYNTIQYNTIQYNTSIHTIQYHTIPYNTIQYHTIQYHTIPYNTIQYNTIQYHTIPYNTIQYHTIQYNTIQYNTIKYNNIQYNTIQYHTIPYHTIQYHTIHRQYYLVFSVSALVFGWGAQYLPEAEGRGQIRHRGQIQGGYWKHQVMLYLLHTWTVFVRFCL